MSDENVRVVSKFSLPGSALVRTHVGRSLPRGSLQMEGGFLRLVVNFDLSPALFLFLWHFCGSGAC